MIRRTAGLWLGFMGIAALLGCASKDPLKPPKLDQPLIAFSYDDYGAVLAKVVTPDGYVRWDLLQTNDGEIRDRLVKFVGLIAAASPDNRPDLFATPRDRWAYWINAHNALCMYWVMRHSYPAAVGPKMPDPFLVGGKAMSVDQIAAQLAEQCPDLRIYFALNFCAHSCPPLRNTPYDGAVLDAQLVDQARVYLGDPRAVVRQGDAALVNDILLKYQEEFGHQDTPASTGFLAVLTTLANEDSPLNGAKSLGKLGFDWSLNRPPR
ncbi:MAG: DUF547 domain-containing protein [Tepidisphaeraceae bacterium]